ncbi:hypothetical protein [Alteromonas sp. 14N.309.X.WAT.G.H12]|uniref:ATP-grasp domain-containing protein n=1 Tax=Alteromonas sp. 14N.309.X.WAT.G.H12 TaxID=3120824 RepID=UPI002FD6882A
MLALCLGDGCEPQLQHMVEALTTANVETCILNTAQFPQNLRIHFNAADNQYIMKLQHRQYDLGAFGVFYWQRFIPPAHGQNTTLLANLTSALSPLFLTHSHRWFNSLHAVRYHQAKPVQLVAARKLGATIPDTCISNDVQRIRAFCDSQHNVIVKPVFGGTYSQSIKRNGKWQSSLCSHLVDEPMTFQSWIEGMDIRSFVVGERVLSAKIDSAADDYRIDTSAMAVKTKVPKAIEALSIRLCRKLGMKWCAIDWRKTPAGHYVFLEANPCPMFCRFELDTGLPITEALLEAMIKTAGSAASQV